MASAMNWDCVLLLFFIIISFYELRIVSQVQLQLKIRATKIQVSTFKHLKTAALGDYRASATQYAFE